MASSSYYFTPFWFVGASVDLPKIRHYVSLLEALLKNPVLRSEDREKYQDELREAKSQQVMWRLEKYPQKYRSASGGSVAEPNSSAIHQGEILREIERQRERLVQVRLIPASGSGGSASGSVSAEVPAEVPAGFIECPVCLEVKEGFDGFRCDHKVCWNCLEGICRHSHTPLCPLCRAKPN